MTEMTRQERDSAHYRSEVRKCPKCSVSYQAGGYGEHRASEKHELFLRAKVEMAELRQMGDAFMADSYCSDLLGRPSPGMPASELVALLEV